MAVLLFIISLIFLMLILFFLSRQQVLWLSEEIFCRTCLLQPALFILPAIKIFGSSRILEISWSIRCFVGFTPVLKQDTKALSMSWIHKWPSFFYDNFSFAYAPLCPNPGLKLQIFIDFSNQGIVIVLGIRWSMSITTACIAIYVHQWLCLYEYIMY